MPWFEDIQVGDSHRFGRYPVSREEVVDFASRYDPQPFHLSDEGAASTHFGSLAASGWHSCAMTMAMVVREMQAHPERQDASLGALGIDELRWLKPVRPGDVLSVGIDVVGKIPSRGRKDMGVIRQQVTLFNQDDEPVMRFVGLAMVRTRPEA